MKEPLTPQQELTLTYRRVFDSYEGRLVLRDILAELYHFTQTTNPEEVALRNYSMRLLDKIGGFPADKAADDELESALVEAYLTKPTVHVGEE